MKKFILALFSFLLLSVAVLPFHAYALTTATILPTADGNYKQFTPKSGTSHFAMVDESSCNGNTDHNRTTVVGERDSYVISLSSIPNNSTITQIDITPCASRNSAGAADPVMNVFYRLNSVDSADAGAYALTGTTPVDLSTTSYSSLSIAKTGTTALEIGAVLTSSTKGVKLSRIAAVITYTVPSVPTASTNAASGVASKSAILNSTVNPNGQATTVYYKYGTSNVACPSLGSSTSGTLIGSGTSNVSPNARTVSSLNANTTYYFCAVAYNATGATSGAVLNFTTLSLSPPSVTTSAASDLVTVGASSSATLNSIVNPNGENTLTWYRYDTVNTTCDLLSSSTSAKLIGNGFSNVSPNAKSIGFLTPSTTYYFCAVGSSFGGTTFGDVLNFTTLP